MPDAVKLVRGAGISLACELLAAECVPETKLNADASAGLLRDAPNNHALCIDGAPIGEMRHLVNICIFVGECCRINWRKRPALLEVGNNDL